MMNRMSVLVLGATVAGVSVLALVGFGDGEGHTICPSASCNPSSRSGTVLPANRPNHPYGKIELPAELSVSLGQAGGDGDPLTVVVVASSLVPVESGIVTLMVPGIGAEPNRTEMLWTGTPADFVSETAVYEVDALPVGQYCFTAAFELTPSGGDADTIATSQSLYVDVRESGILSSNVSFEQIQRLELRRELERRILAELKPRLAVASEEAVATELARLEDADPGFLDRRIAELKAADPNVARRILELNERQIQTTEDAGIGATNR